MRFALALAVLLSAGGTAPAQVINGESTDDAAFAPRPAARWHSPEWEGEQPGGRLDDTRDEGARAERPRER